MQPAMGKSLSFGMLNATCCRSAVQTGSEELGATLRSVCISTYDSNDNDELQNSHLHESHYVKKRRDFCGCLAWGASSTSEAVGVCSEAPRKASRCKSRISHV